MSKRTPPRKNDGPIVPGPINDDDETANGDMGLPFAWPPMNDELAPEFDARLDSVPVPYTLQQVTDGLLPGGDDEDLTPFADDCLAERFGDLHANDLKFCKKFGEWFVWRDGCWRQDERAEVLTMARRFCRAQSREAARRGLDEKIVADVQSGSTIHTVMRLATGDERFATIPAEWDSDLWALNTPAGVVDLRTGALKPHDRKALMSKITAVGPNNAECPLWTRFLDDVTQADPELIGFLQRLLGYALTGSVCEHILAFFYGSGANGKSVFLNTVLAILGDYATTAPMTTFEVSRNEQHPTDLAGPRGARLVTAQETESGKRWAEAKVKTMTGGDVIKARFMRMDFFEYQPQFKLLIAGNHKPGLRHADEAMRRRFRLVPFTVVVPPNKRDRHLPERLKPEWPTILRWMIKGCLEWQRDGLQPPQRVLAATDEYFADTDTFAQWRKECLVQDKTACSEKSALFASWSKFAEAAGEPPGKARELSDRLKVEGFKETLHPTSRRAAFAGLQLIHPGVNHGDDPRYGV